MALTDKALMDQALSVGWHSCHPLAVPMPSTEVHICEGRDVLVAGLYLPSFPGRAEVSPAPLHLPSLPWGRGCSPQSPLLVQPHRWPGRGFAVQGTVETTKTLPRLIQLVSLHPIKRVIFSSCSAQEPHGRARLPGSGWPR